MASYYIVMNATIVYCIPKRNKMASFASRNYRNVILTLKIETQISCVSYHLEFQPAREHTENVPSSASKKSVLLACSITQMRRWRI